MNSISLAKRAINTPASPIRKLSSLAVEAKKRGIKIYHLNIGQPDLPTPSSFFSEIKKFSQKTIAYAPSEGLPEAIAAWQIYFQQHKIPFTKEEIIVTTGGSEAIVFALSAIADPGDEIIIFEPLYTNYLTFAQMASVKLVPVTTHLEEGFHLPADSVILKKITKKTKGIIICNPSNPTGTVYQRSELKRIAEIAKRHNLFVISDEVYRELVFHGHSTSMMEFSSIWEQLIIVDSVSKRFNICGARIGCLASKNKEVRESALKFAQGRLSSPTLEQLAVIPLLKDYRRYTDPIIKEYQQRRDVVADILKTIPGVSFFNPEGTFYLIARLPIKDAEHFSRWLIEEFQDKKETIMLAPAQGFYKSLNLGKTEVRIAFVLNKKCLIRAMEILKIALVEFKE